MKILMAIAVIAALGLVCLLRAMAWYLFEDTRIGYAITNKIIERINK